MLPAIDVAVMQSRTRQLTFTPVVACKRAAGPRRRAAGARGARGDQQPAAASSQTAVMQNIIERAPTHPHAQVVAFANALRGLDGAPLVRAAHVATNSPPPRDVPDLVTATPAGLITATQNYGPFFGWEWTRAGIMARCGAPLL